MVRSIIMSFTPDLPQHLQSRPLRERRDYRIARLLRWMCLFIPAGPQVRHEEHSYRSSSFDWAKQATLGLAW